MTFQEVIYSLLKERKRSINEIMTFVSNTMAKQLTTLTTLKNLIATVMAIMKKLTIFGMSLSGRRRKCIFPNTQRIGYL